MRGTTLVAPGLWAILATVSLAMGVAMEGNPSGTSDEIGLSALRFAAASTTLCPLVAVLGAKRPQHRAWQWVVLSLWIVVVWPAAQAVLSPVGTRVELFIAWKLFLDGLIGVGVLNYLPTRFRLAALLVAAGQTILLGEYLFDAPLLPQAWTTPVGLGFLLAAASVVVIQSRQETRRRLRNGEGNVEPLDACNERWLSFRDAFGAFWALRILGRVNQTAEIRAWPLRLAWSGFLVEDAAAATPTREQLEQLQQTLDTLLRRFVAVSEGSKPYTG